MYRILLFWFGVLGLVAPVRGQGDLPPPGAPAPVMKTLDQLEPRREVNPGNTPGDATALFRITQGGSYYVSQTLTGASGKAGIVIAANDVTLDLNGCALVGVPGSLAGVAAAGLVANVRVHNGAVRGWGGAGVDLATGKQVHLDRLRIADNGGAGLQVGEHVWLQDCVVTGNGTTGIVVAAGGILRGCVSRNNGAAGISAGQEALLFDCVAQQNGADGIALGVVGIVEGCVARENNRHGLTLANSGIIRRCNAHNNASNGVTAVTGYITRNNVNNNHTGINVAGGLTVDNQCVGNYPGAGLQHSGSGYLFRNFATGNGTNYVADAGCQAITNLCPIAVTNPWNNFQ